MTESQRPRILIVENEPQASEILTRWLEAEGHECVLVSDVDEACQQLEQDGFSALLADIVIAEKSGIELVAKAKEHDPDVAIILVAPSEDHHKVIKFLKMGAYGSVMKPLDQDEVTITVAHAVERRRLLLDSRQTQQHVKEEIQARIARMGEREEHTILRLVWAAECRDEATGDHIRRIGLYSATLAEALGWDQQQVDDIRLAATMHDIGKIGIADGILLRAERLTSEEFAVLRRHTEMGARILAGSEVPMLQMARDIALCHHERWDGSGYSQGLAAEEIPESGRIVAIVDVYDALSHPRVYRPAHPEEEVTAIMADGRDKHFDPRIFDCFLEVKSKFQHIRKEVVPEGVPS
ncbi:MAG: response regulator [Acidobacteria bacterium]|nr:response regulator [Acidobacteriota bacterium]